MFILKGAKSTEVPDRRQPCFDSENAGVNNLSEHCGGSIFAQLPTIRDYQVLKRARINICFAQGFHGECRYSLINHGRTGALLDLSEKGMKPGVQ